MNEPNPLRLVGQATAFPSVWPGSFSVASVVGPQDHMGHTPYSVRPVLLGLLRFEKISALLVRPPGYALPLLVLSAPVVVHHVWAPH